MNHLLKYTLKSTMSRFTEDLTLSSLNNIHVEWTNFD